LRTKTIGNCRVKKCDGFSTDKLPIVFIHGAWGSSEHFDWYANEFTMKNYHTYQIKLPAHDINSFAVPRYSLQEYASMVSLAIRRIGKKCIVIGHSMGGLLAQKAAEQNPDLVQKVILIASAPPRGIFLFNPPMIGRVVRHKPYRDAMLHNRPLIVEEIDQNKFLFNIDEPENEQLWHTQWKAKLLPESSKALFQLSLLSLPVKKLKQPILFFASEADRLVPFKTSWVMYKKKHTNSQLHRYYYDGHYFFLDPRYRKQILKDMLRFIAE
jgi:pimeloyl-ACP methyl ester carboxylesterase